MAQSFNVHCMLCGRPAGQVRNGSFRRHPGAPPLATRAGKQRCGYCVGSLYLEAEDSPFIRDIGRYGEEQVAAAKRAS